MKLVSKTFIIVWRLIKKSNWHYNYYKNAVNKASDSRKRTTKIIFCSNDAIIAKNPCNLSLQRFDMILFEFY